MITKLTTCITKLTTYCLKKLSFTFRVVRKHYNTLLKFTIGPFSSQLICDIIPQVGIYTENFSLLVYLSRHNKLDNNNEMNKEAVNH